MLFSYSVHDRGASHVEDDLPCQDSYQIVNCDEGYIVAAIADGLGSCPKSHISSRIAVDGVTNFIKENFPMNPGIASLTSLMITAMNHGYKSIYNALKEQDIPLEDAHTTLSVCLYNGEKAILGHCGDGVIIGLEKDGTYSVLCEPMKGDLPNSTDPFTYGSDYWKVSVVERPLDAVLIATDGIGDVIYPPFLRPDHEVLLAHASFFMHPKELALQGRILDEACSKNISETTLNAIREPTNKNWSEVTDDLTAVIIINSESEPPEIENKQTADYLREKINNYYGFRKKSAGLKNTSESEDSNTAEDRRVAPDVNIDEDKLIQEEVTLDSNTIQSKRKSFLRRKMKIE